MVTEKVIKHSDNYKWYILTLIVLTEMFVIAIPTMGVSVLSKEISDELQLSLVQIGIVWGAGALPGLITSLLGGMIGDKIGPKSVLIFGSLLGGILGLARGFAVDFISITVLMVLLGAITPVVLMNFYKSIGQWFPSKQLGLANGVIAMGMALGFLIGAFFSATTFSPWLGGWRNVLIFYGGIGVFSSIPWIFTRSIPVDHGTTEKPNSIWKPLAHVSRLKNIWLLSFGLFGFSGAVQGMLGYLPLYLRGINWLPINADGALSAFHTVSMVFVLPIALWSDRLGSRKRLLLITNLFVVIGFGMLGFVNGGLVWAAVLLSGFVRDGFMAMFTTMVVETDRVGPQFAGTATGFTMAFASLSNFIAPPLGNSLASFWPAAPFVFWSLLSLFGLVCLSMVKESRKEKSGK